MAFSTVFSRSAVGFWKRHALKTRWLIDIRPMTTTTSSFSSWNRDDTTTLVPGAAVAAAVALAATWSLATSSDNKNNNNNQYTANDNTKSAINRRWTPANVAREDFDEMVTGHDSAQAKLPVFTSDQVAENNGDDGKPIWVTYGMCFMCLYCG
jgi:hypothetical protein